jgi:hypothetical protein
MVVVMVVSVVMVVGVSVTASGLPELAHFAIHLHLSQLRFNFPLS